MEDRQGISIVPKHMLYVFSDQKNYSKQTRHTRAKSHLTPDASESDKDINIPYSQNIGLFFDFLGINRVLENAGDSYRSSVSRS